MSSERRIHSRLSARVPARLVQGAERVEGVVENVGEGGVFFATEVLETLLDEGSQVEVEFEGVQAGAPVQIRRQGTVLRMERYFDGQAVVRAFAIRFSAPLDVHGLGFA